MSNSAHSTSLPPNGQPPSAAVHHQWLDFLRFIAALLVMLGHARGFVLEDFGTLDSASRNPVVGAFFAITRLGHEAVIVFFVLSGFLVGGKAFERIAKQTFIPREYAIDRTTRLWVPLIPALLLTGLASNFSDGPLIWIGNLLGLQGVVVPMLGGNDPLWSLAYEIWFYVGMYAVGRLALKKTGDLAALALLATVVMVFSKLQVQYLICWLIGAALYVRPPTARRSNWVLASALSLAGIAGLQLSSKGALATFSGNPGISACLELILATGTGVACTMLQQLEGTRLSRFAPQWAAFSYSLYLTHFPVLLFLRNSGLQRHASINLESMATYLAACALCIAVAWMMYLPFERNTLLIRDMLRQRLS